MMVTTVVTFRKSKSPDEAAGLLSAEQRASAITHNSPTGIKKVFSVFKKKNKEGKDRHHDPAPYEPPTAPPSPEDDRPLNVTVLASEFDPTNPYRMTSADTTISDITGFATGSPNSRKALGPADQDNDASKESMASPPPSSNRDSVAESGFDPAGTMSTSNAAVASLPTATNAAESTEAGIFDKTLQMFDDICQVHYGKRTLEPLLTAVTDSPPADSRRASKPQWGSVPSEDEDDSYLDTTLDDSYDPTNSSTGLQTSANNTTTLSSHPAVPAKKLPEEPRPPAHENFEVVLDPLLLHDESPKRRGWFGSKPRDSEEGDEGVEDDEEKKEDIPEEYPVDYSMPYSSRGTEETTAEGINRRASWAQLKSLVTMKKGKESTEDHPEDENEALHANESLRGTKFLESASARQSWHSILGQLQSLREMSNSEEQEGSEEPEEVSKTRDATSKMEKIRVLIKAKNSTVEQNPEMEGGRKQKNDKEEATRKKHMFVVNAIAKLKKPIAALRKRSSEKKVRVSSNVSLGSSSRMRRPKTIWKSAVDPKTGRTYYYHRKTRETTWIKPKELEDYENQTSTGKEVTLEESKQEISNDELEVDKAQTTSNYHTPPRKLGDAEVTPGTGESPMKPPLNEACLVPDDRSTGWSRNGSSNGCDSTKFRSCISN